MHVHWCQKPFWKNDLSKVGWGGVVGRMVSGNGWGGASWCGGLGAIRKGCTSRVGRGDRGPIRDGVGGG